MSIGSATTTVRCSMNRLCFLYAARLATLSTFILACSSCAVMGLSRLSADPIDARVVDTDTGQPIEGVVAVAYWPLSQGSLAGDSLPCGAANVEEAVSDKDGYFHLSGWGPVKNPCRGVMEEGEPLIYLFKAGYYYNQIVANGITSHSAVSSTGSGWWVDHPMKLKAFKDVNYSDIGPGTYYLNFDVLNTYIETFVVHMPYQCNWKKIPNMLRVLEIERRKFRFQGSSVDGVTNQLIGLDQWFQTAAPTCGSPKEFMEGLMK